MPSSQDIEELKKELKKLKPENRLKKLKEFEESRKAEINDIEKLIKDSEKDLKNEEVAENIAPAQTDVDIGKLFHEEAEHLEATVKNTVPEHDGEKQQYLSLKQLQDDYTALQDITYASMDGNLTPKHLEAIDRIGERLDRTKYQTTGKETANILVASRAVLYKIRKYAGLE